MIIQLAIYWILVISTKKIIIIAIDLSKQLKLKDPQQISFIGKLFNRHGGTMFFIVEILEETTFKFSHISATII